MYIKTVRTCPECNKDYRYAYYVLNRVSGTEDTLYCPWCHKRIRYSRWIRYGQTWKVVGDVIDPLDNSQISAIIESRKR